MKEFQFAVWTLLSKTKKKFDVKIPECFLFWVPDHIMDLTSLGFSISIYQTAPHPFEVIDQGRLLVINGAEYAILWKALCCAMTSDNGD